MVTRLGLCPRAHVDMSGTGVVSHGGGVAPVETARAAGLDRALSATPSRRPSPMAIHDPAKVITGLAITLALGGDCLADVGQRLSYSVGFSLPDGLAQTVATPPKHVWTLAGDGDGDAGEGAWVAAVTGLLDLKSWPAGMRVVARKERPNPGAELRIANADWRGLSLGSGKLAAGCRTYLNRYTED